MREGTLEKMLHTAAELRALLDGSDMTEAQRAFVQTTLANMETAFHDQADQVRAIRAAMPRRDDAGGRTTVAYVDQLLGKSSKGRLH
ncbi:hypothetical protein MKK67_00490 [Methylobacterium sp. J-072]|uniref:hypothetical protein n=1 Tax=Methylobacterium sp. J-072 TaxID=2836651 RepID=UPI001FBA2E92|nr:hypothetical protein [Methylobacterium sp. J-072]MCJ2090993.1 hypothetical protein [Methylobacterium sp. J-072]